MHTDEHLNDWGDRFARSALRACMRFDQFMALSAPMRQRKMYMAEQSAQQDIQPRLEAQVPDLVQRGDHLIEPLHHTVGSAGDRPLWQRLRRTMK
jgi:hypothetical protein